jgi:hypothetical protein
MNAETLLKLLKENRVKFVLKGMDSQVFSEHADKILSKARSFAYTQDDIVTEGFFAVPGYYRG